MEFLIGVLSVLLFAAILTLVVVFLVLPGVVVFWLLVLRTLRVPKVVALLDKWEREWDYPKDVVAFANATYTSREQVREQQSLLLRLPSNSSEWNACGEELKTMQKRLKLEEDGLVAAVLQHMTRIGKIK